MSRRNLAVADLTRTADINDKLAVLDELTQRLDEQGKLSLVQADIGDYVGWKSFVPVRTASAGTWTLGTIDTAAYRIIGGEEMAVLFSITGSSVSATPAYLQIDIPGGFKARFNVTEALTAFDNGVAATGSKRVIANDTKIYLAVGPAITGNWAASVVSTQVYFSFTFAIKR